MSLTKDQRALISLDKDLAELGIVNQYKHLTKVELLLKDYLTLDESIITIKNQIALLSPTDHPVLIIGETGVGKELLAQALNADRTGEFIGVNACSIPDTLLESEFFGYAQGAFTGATTSKKGFFDLASNGTLFLDEIGDLPRLLQGKLLRALQERSFYRVGGKERIIINCRIVSATNNEHITDKKIFRDDLYYRLAGSVLRVKPLRERPQDIPLIVSSKLKDELHKNKFIDLYKEYTWLGNVRELLYKIDEYKIFNRVKEES